MTNKKEYAMVLNAAEARENFAKARAHFIVQRIILDMKTRHSFDAAWDSCEEDIKDKIIEEWERIAEELMLEETVTIE